MSLAGNKRMRTGMPPRRVSASALLGLALAGPGQAAAAAPGGNPAPGALASGCVDGYRSESVLQDFILKESWTVFGSCGHPEMPRVAVAPVQSGVETRAGVKGQGAQLPQARPVVQAGSRVRLWRREEKVSLNLAAIALGSGVPGASILVRLAAGGRVLKGTVREAGSVEWDAAPGSGFRGGER